MSVLISELSSDCLLQNLPIPLLLCTLFFVNTWHYCCITLPFTLLGIFKRQMHIQALLIQYYCTASSDILYISSYCYRHHYCQCSLILLNKFPRSIPTDTAIINVSSQLPSRFSTLMYQVVLWYGRWLSWYPQELLKYMSLDHSKASKLFQNQNSSKAGECST